jgi:hypothetical protein
MKSVKWPNIVLQQAVATGVRVLSFVAVSRAFVVISLALVRLVMSGCAMSQAVYLLL